MSWWDYFSFSNQAIGQTVPEQASEPIGQTVTTEIIIMARRSKVMQELLGGEKRHTRKAKFVTDVKVLLAKAEQAKGRENKMVVAYKIFDYLVTNRSSFWKLGYSKFPQATLDKIYQLQNDGMDLSTQYKKLFPNAPLLKEFAPYSETFIPNVKFWSKD